MVLQALPSQDQPLWLGEIKPTWDFHGFPGYIWVLYLQITDKFYNIYLFAFTHAYHDVRMFPVWMCRETRLKNMGHH